MKLATKRYVKQKVREYLSKQHPEMSRSRIERIASYNAAHPLSYGYDDEDPSSDVDVDACVCRWYWSLNPETPCDHLLNLDIDTHRVKHKEQNHD